MVLRPIACAHVSETEAAASPLRRRRHRQRPRRRHRPRRRLVPRSSTQLVKGSMTLIDTERARRALPGARVGGRDERRVGGQHDVRRRQLRRTGGLHRQGHRRRARRGVRPRPARRRRGVPARRPVAGDADRALHHRRHPRRPAHDEHLPRGVEPAGADDVDEAAVADGEVLYMEGYLFDRDDAKEAFRQAAEVAHDHGRQGVAHAVGLVLRRPPPRRLPPARARRRSTSCSATRTSCCRSTSSTTSTPPSRRCARDVRAGGDHARRGRLASS